MDANLLSRTIKDITDSDQYVASFCHSYCHYILLFIHSVIIFLDFLQ